MAYLYAILGLSVLIVVHEAGHMMIARLFGMRVRTFSVGFGPTLLRWRGRKTTYQLAMVPLGGFVQIAGMNPNENLPEGDPGSYANKSIAARMATILAGPLTNYLTAMVIMIGVMLTWGMPGWKMDTQVSAVISKGPAEKAGMKAGDKILAIDGKKVTTFQEVVARITASKGATMRFQVSRAGKERDLAVTANKAGKIGIEAQRKLTFTDISAGSAVLLGIYYPFHESKRALASLGNWLGGLFSGESSTQQVGGPVEIVHQLKLSFEQSTIMALIFLAMLSAYLGLFNLLPMPALDGGRLLFLLATLVGRRQVNQRFENTVHTIGFILLLGLIAMVTYCDVARQFSR